MGKERTAHTIKIQKPEPDPPPIIVGEGIQSFPRLRTVKSKKIKVTTTARRSATTTVSNTCEISGHIMRLCINLMPVLASAKEPEEEEEEDKKNCSSEEKSETSNKNDPSITESEEKTQNRNNSHMGLNLDQDRETQPLNPLCVLPPITQPKPTPELYDHQRPLQFLTSPSAKSQATAPNKTTGCESQASVLTCQILERRPWIDNPLYSKCRSPEFRLPEISLSSLDVLLQTVTQKLRRKRRGGDEGQQRLVQSDHLLYDNVQWRLRERRVGQQSGHSAEDGDRAIVYDCDTETSTSMGGCRFSRQTSLPPLRSETKHTLVFAMTKRNPLTSNAFQRIIK